MPRDKETITKDDVGVLEFSRKAPPGQHRTATEMERADPKTLKVYHLTKAQGMAALKAAGLIASGEDLTAKEVVELRKVWDKGGLDGKLALHVVKWLRDEDSTTTIPLTEVEAKQVNSSLRGKTLQEVKRS